MSSWERYLTGENWLDDFGGGSRDDSGAAAREAYEKWAQKAIDEYRTSREQGRGDITGYYGKALGMESPYLEAGEKGLSAYMGTLGLGDRQGALDTFKTSPGYKFMKQQGQDALTRQSAGTGMAGSGAEKRELLRYGTGMAEQEYGKYQDRLAQLASGGQSMAALAGGQALQTGGALADLSRAYAEDIGGAYQGIGKSEAESYMAQPRGGGLASLLGPLGTIGGGILGGIYGGPGGAAAGASVGGSAGRAIGGSGAFGAENAPRGGADYFGGQGSYLPALYQGGYGAPYYGGFPQPAGGGGFYGPGGQSTDGQSSGGQSEYSPLVRSILEELKRQGGTF